MPKLKRFDEIYLNAYNVLANSRGSGMAGPQPISLTEISAYFSVLGIDDQAERVKYVALIQRLDQVYLQHAGEQSAKNKKP